MNQDVLLWIGGIIATAVGALGLFGLQRALAALDRLEKKLTAHGELFARLETTVGHITKDVRELQGWRQAITDRALIVAEQRAVDAERRSGPPDRRES